MPKKAKRREPSIAVPTINPFTGRKFTSEAEKKKFVDAQKVKRDEMLAARQVRKDLREVAANKIVAFFQNNNISKEELELVFGRRYFVF